MSGNGQGVRLVAGEKTFTIKVGLPESTLIRLEAFAASEKLDRSRAAWRLIDQSLPSIADQEDAGGSP